MRSRIYKAWALCTTIILALTACGPNDKGSTPPGRTTTAEKQAEGTPIDVYLALRSQGFAQSQINAVEKNAAYWLRPFRMGKNPPHGQSTCVFMMVHRDYKKGDAYADHRIKALDSPVQLTGYVVGSDGENGAALPKTVLTEFNKLSPSWLAGADFGGQGVCGDLAVK